MTSKSSTGHTPGPWEVENAKATHTHHRWRVGSVSKLIAAILDTPSGQEEIANARLIAAAPDLLEACEAALMDEGGGFALSYGTEMQLKDAIAKARGQGGGA